MVNPAEKFITGSVENDDLVVALDPQDMQSVVGFTSVKPKGVASAAFR